MMFGNLMKVTPLYAEWLEPPKNIHFSSPYDLFREDDGLPTMLTACGEPPELLPNGDASDFEKFSAVCRFLLLSPGNPLRRRILTLLSKGFSWSDPKPEPSALWQHLMQHISPAEQEDELTFASLAVHMGVNPEKPDGRTWQMLPDQYVFTQPDAYHAAMYQEKKEAGETLTPAERDLLLTQKVRKQAEKCLACSAPLKLAGTHEQLGYLAHYLFSVHRLPKLLCAVTDPEMCSEPLSFPAGVRIALYIRGNESPGSIREKLSCCAACTPLLALDGVLMTIQRPTDLGQVAVWESILQEFLHREEGIRL